MNHTRLWVAATIIALFVIGGFVLSVPHTRDLTVPQAERAIVIVPTVTMRDTFKKGLHTISGSIDASNACVSASAKASFASTASSTAYILLEIATTDASGVCLQVPTRVSFQTTIAAPSQTPITVTVNGAVATTNTP
ncbi:MAG: hypothetical protein NT108_01465 [Candidatus Kaiserbacteria bacterium]|nr:hypothetical protein [Candidatus Kaiserbacteria bacterium]